MFRKARPGERKMGPNTRAREQREKNIIDQIRKKLYQQGLSNKDIIEKFGPVQAAKLGIGGRPPASKQELLTMALLKRKFCLTEAQVDEAIYFGITDEKGNVTFKGSRRSLGPTKAKPKPGLTIKKKKRSVRDVLKEQREGRRKNRATGGMIGIQRGGIPSRPH